MYFNIKRISLIMLLVVLCTFSVWAKENGENFSEEVTKVSLLEKANDLAISMDDITTKKKGEWSFNAYEHKFTDKYFSPWVDPLAYNSYWYMYYPPKVREYYDAEKFKLDNVLFYHNPQLGTSIAPIAFAFDELKYRFYIGVGFLMSGHFLMLGHGATLYYGTHLFLNSVIQVEPYIDFIYKDNLRIRLTPIRHVCYHMSGDILGDNELHTDSRDPSTIGTIDRYKDVGFEQVHASANYRWGWFNFYGGVAAAVTNFWKCSYINLAYLYAGAEMKYPVFGDFNIIAGLHLGANYDRLGDLTHNMDDNTYSIKNTYEEWTPLISAGLGFGIHDWIIGLKFDYGRSRQIYAVEHMESRIGLSAYLYL